MDDFPPLAAADDAMGRQDGLPVAVLAEPVALVEEDEDDDFDHAGNEIIRRRLRRRREAPEPDAVHGDGDAEDGNPLFVRFARGRNVDSITSFLFDMIREDHTCTSVLGGWSRRTEGCSKVVSHCSEHPEEAFYVAMNGRTALHEACLRGACSHIVKALLEANPLGAMERDHMGNSALHLLFVDYSTRSMINPQEIDSIVGELLNTNPTLMASATNLLGSTPLHMACSAPETMVNPNSLMQLINANPACASKVNVSNQTALRLHCERRNASVEVARMLLNVNPEALYVLDRVDGWAPLHYAAANANLDLIRFLVEANPSAACVRTSPGNSTALHLLCRQSLTAAQLPAIDVLLRADPNSVIQRDSPSMHTPLHLVCRGSRVSLEVVERLTSCNPQAASIADSEHYLPLHHACEIGCESQIVALLLEKYPSAAHAMTRKQDSALSLACTCNQSVETVRLLIQANPDALGKKNDYGFAPLHCVCRAYQPRMGIVQALVDACPSCVTLKTHGGETPVHLACSNSGAFVGVLQLLTMAQNRQRRMDEADQDLSVDDSKPMTSKVGNTPLHDACFRGSPFEHIETLAMANPEWIMVRNNAGYSPLQILCKNGRIDERIVTTFSRIGGPEIFSVIDSTGNTPLHSAMREDMDVATLKCLIRALPDALHLKTVYGDSPLHLACFRRANPEVVREVALASSTGHISPVLEPNSAGQTPIGIAMDEFRSVCRGRRFCCVVSEYRPEQSRVFQVLATLVKILYYGPNHQDHKHLSLVRACVALHRQDVRLDPAFIRRAIHLYPEEARVMDEEGNFPLHIEASIPIEKMSLLDATAGCCEGVCHKRMGILRMLLEVFPGATEARNKHGQFPLGLMIQNGRVWGHEVALALRAFPPALHWYKGLDDRILAHIVEKASKECGADTLFALLTSRPDVFPNRCNRQLVDTPMSERGSCLGFCENS